ncbi:MAG: hypothetical protein BWX58_00528 [Deltaproteobacteria bacterium ADurb.Bin026]|nr:MAG: hypothetical protein BWX58_00528 [Deltaproteobacteria bacterium ADurb.Bin026]
MSPNTAPGSTDASCSLSPSIINLACLGVADISFAIRGKSIMDASSTIIASYGRRLSSLNLNSFFLKVEPSNLCVVDAVSGISIFTASEQLIFVFASFMTALKRAAAFPVGAVKAILRSTFACIYCSAINASILDTVYVLPVPGPPEITTKLFFNAFSAARYCQSISSDRRLGKNRFNPSFNRLSLIPETGVSILSIMFFASMVSYCQ